MRTTLTIILLIFSLVAGAEVCRSPATVREFNKLHGFYHNPPNTIVDHICPLSVGGLDIVGNMQYQSKIESRLKDKWERLPSKRSLLCNETNSKPYRTVFNCKD